MKYKSVCELYRYPCREREAVTPSIREAVEWRPIETAPKLGRFLACCVDPDDWKAGASDPYDNIEIVSGPVATPAGPKWLNHNSNNYTSLRFTHWLPLPSPPSPAGEKSE